jgi:ElaB/YqjD/DUF883 family membrane-anchored ribosome-binding protein
MEKDNVVPGARTRTGTGTGTGTGAGAQNTGLGAGTSASGAGYAAGGTGGLGGNDSLADKGSELLSEGRDRAEDLVESGKDRAKDALEGGRERAGQALDSGKSRLADGISRLGERLDEQATNLEGQGGLGSRASRYMQYASDAAEDSAEYLRSHDLDVIRDDFASQVRARPLLSCGIALGAGFLLGSAGSSGSSRRDRDDERWSSSRGHDRYHDDDDDDDDGDESGLRAQLGRVIVSGVTTLLTREIQSRVRASVSGRNR